MTVITDETKHKAVAAYQRYVQLVEHLGKEETQKLDQLITNLEQEKIATIHQLIEQL